MAASQIREWKPEEDETLRKMFDEGKFYYEIGNRLHRSASAVNRRRAVLGLSRKLVNARNAVVWSAEQDFMLRELTAAGTPRSAMARQLAMTEWLVRDRQIKLGIALPPKPKTEKKPYKARFSLDPDDSGVADTSQRVLNVKQDKLFQAAMRAAVLAGTERIPTATVTKLDTVPRRFVASPISSGCGSSAAQCAE